MSISTNYDYLRYTQYGTQTSSTSGQQKVHHKGHSKGTDSTLQLLQTVDNSAKNTSTNKSKDPLDSLVDSGTITSDQKKAIKDAFEASRMAYQAQAGTANSAAAFKNPLDSLVSNGTITEDQESAIKSAFESDKKAHRMPPPPQLQQGKNSDPMSDTLDKLVKSGTITSDQKDSIISAMQSAFQLNQPQAGNATDPLDSLASCGTITEDQESAIKSAFDSDRKAHGMPPPPQPQDDGGDPMSSILESLVKDGKITSEQQETIITALQSAFQSSQTQLNTETDPLESLVSSGTITNDQSSAVKSAFESAIKAYQNQSYSYDDSFWNSYETQM